MTVKQPIFQQNDTTDQSADIGRLLIRDLVNERGGLVQEAAFQVAQRAAGANNSVDVQPGGFVVPGTEGTAQGFYYVVNDAVINVPMSAPANGANPRIDSLVLEVRDGFYSGVNNDARVVYQAGTAAASPVQPDLTALGYKNYWRLANIAVPANDNTIVTADITDTRSLSGVRATALGAPMTCTSTTRPTLPRVGQLIWELDTGKLLVNAGTAVTPVWQRPAPHIVAQQKLTSDSAVFSADGSSDFVLNNVPVIQNHVYAVHAHSDVTYASVDVDARWVVRLRVNGANNSVLADMEPRVAGVVRPPFSPTVYWTAPATQPTDDFTIFMDLAVAGATVQFEASATNPRFFTIIDHGPL
jgi:hypothetical protein